MHYTDEELNEVEANLGKLGERELGRWAQAFLSLLFADLREARHDARVRAEARREVLDIVVSEAAAQVDLKPHQEKALRADILAALDADKVKEGG